LSLIVKCSNYFDTNCNRERKNGSFDFAEGLASVSGQKQMCHCGSAIVLKNVRWAKNKKHRVGLSVGSLIFSIFRFSVLSQWFTFNVSMSLSLSPTLGGNVWPVTVAMEKYQYAVT